MKLSTIGLTCATLCIASCSSMNTVVAPAAGDVDGLAYYMPKKDFVITITMKEGKPEAVTFGTTASYPDLSKQYVLRYARNAFGKNTLDVEVTESGLLTSSKSTTESKVAEAFRNIAASKGSLSASRINRSSDAPGDCPAAGVHAFVFNAPGSYIRCDVAIEIIKRSETAAIDSTKESATEHSGIFYRQNVPYEIRARANGLNLAAIVFSPTGSGTHFLPVSRTFFSDNSADLAFENGIPKKYKQETDGEAVSLFKLPADILGAYFGAVGTMFDNFKTNDSKEAAALAESVKLELAKIKYEACIAAIRANEEQKTKDLGCQ